MGRIDTMGVAPPLENMVFPLSPPDEDAVRAMHKSWDRHQLERYLVRWAQSDTPSPPQAFWDYDYRICDMGCGFGKYLLQVSEQHPDYGCLGIDKGSLRGGGMSRRVDTAARPNLFGLHGNAIPILAAMPEESLDQLSIFYPNPWWPAKHRKKRWSYHPLLPKLTRLLKTGGRLILTSNESFYLAEWQYALEHHPHAVRLKPDHVGPVQEQEGRTHFEVKFMAEGTACGEVRYRRAT